MKKRKSLLVFGQPKIESAEIEEVVQTLRSGWLGTGPKVEKFQDLFATYTGAKFALALNSCTAGLHLAMLVAGVGQDDEVITTPLTFCATANAIIHTGARPVFVDVQRGTMNIDPAAIERAIGPRTKAIIPVHFAGRPCEMDAIMALAKKHKILVIEDAAHCIEGRYKGCKIGNIGDLTCFSFYVTKNVVTGEGGMVTTNRRSWADQIRIHGLHGMSCDAWLRYSDVGYKHYQVLYPGYKFNMTDMQASLGIHQLARVEESWKRRSEIWERYNHVFSNDPIGIPMPEEANTKHARHLYTVLIDPDRAGMTRDDFQVKLFDMNIGTGIHFMALHLHEFYAKTYGYKRGDFPNAEFISERTLSLPLSPGLSDEDINDVMEAVQALLKVGTS